MRLHNVVFDCADAGKIAEFWAAVLERSPAEGASEHIAFLPGKPNFLFLRVPEGRQGKNRVHVDLDTEDLEDARRRLEALGATFVHEKDDYGLRWMTFQDPEHNEFCVARH